MWCVVLWQKDTDRGIQKLTRQAGEYRRGNMAEVICVEDYPDNCKELAGHIAGLAEMLRSFTQETQVSADKVSGAVRQVNAAIEHSNALAENIRRDAGLTMHLAGDLTESASQAVQQIDDIKAASETITSNAENIYHESVENKKTAEQGGAAVREAAHAMDGIRQSSAEIEERIFSLTQAAKEIDSFLNAIKSISSQIGRASCRERV
jgi:methyl-accepting chemotaxis protein